MSKPLCREVRVLSLVHNAGSSPEGGGLYSLRLESPGWPALGGWLPGQFVMLRRENPRADCLWARPFSIADSNAEELRIIFQVNGRETAALADLKPGEKLTIWGPLGNSFSVDAQAKTLLLAGGIGLAPFLGYARLHPAPHNLRLELGHRLPLECYPFAACSEQVSARSHLEKGREDLEDFIRVLEEGIRETAQEKGLVLACGPLPFLRTIHSCALRYGARCELSLETRMACGVGACLGCVVRGREPHQHEREKAEFGWVRTCACGPVFRAEDLDLEEGKR